MLSTKTYFHSASAFILNLFEYFLLLKSPMDDKNQIDYHDWWTIWWWRSCRISFSIWILIVIFGIWLSIVFTITFLNNEIIYIHEYHSTVIQDIKKRILKLDKVKKLVMGRTMFDVRSSLVQRQKLGVRVRLLTDECVQCSFDVRTTVRGTFNEDRKQNLSIL